MSAIPGHPTKCKYPPPLGPHTLPACAYISIYMCVCVYIRMLMETCAYIRTLGIIFIFRMAGGFITLEPTQVPVVDRLHEQPN